MRPKSGSVYSILLVTHVVSRRQQGEVGRKNKAIVQLKHQITAMVPHTTTSDTPLSPKAINML